MRNRHNALFLSVIVLLSVLSARAIEPKREVYVVNTKPPSLAIVDTQDWKKIGSIPLDPEPTYAAISRDNSHLYVLHKGLYRPDGLLKEGNSELAILDLEKRERVKQIPLGWNATNFSFSKNGRYLLCISQGKAGKKKTSEESGRVTIVDSQKNEVAATLSAGKLGVEAAVNGDLSRIFVLSRGEPPKKKGAPYTKPMITVFTIDQEKPLAEIELDRAKTIALSRDEKWLYILDPGSPSKKPNEHKNGVVHVVDVPAAKLVGNQEVGTMPRDILVDPKTDAVTVLAQASLKDKRGMIYRLQGSEKPQVIEAGTDLRFTRRLGDQPGVFAFAHEDIRFVPDDGATTTALVPLNPRMKKEPAATALGGYPGEVLYLPDSKRAVMTVRDAFGGSTSRVAIVSLLDNKIEHIITTGRGSVKFGKFVGAMALSVAMTSLSYYAGYSMAQATGSPYFFYNIYSFSLAPPNLELTASEDGKFVYALNTQTNDVTVIATEDGKVLDKIPVGGGCRKVGLAPGGRFVYSHTGGQINLIDTQTNKKHIEHQVQEGKIRALHVIEGDRRLVALTSKALLVWDAEKGSLAHTVAGFDEPYILVERSKDAPLK